MKNRLSLFFAVVLAMTMVMGMSMISYADGPECICCGVNGHTEYEHFYVTSTETYTINPDDPANYIQGIWFKDGVRHECFPSSGNLMENINFPSSIETGWYYRVDSGSEFSKCPLPVVAECEPSSPAHTHNFVWQTIVEPTKDQDGLECEYCACGASQNIQHIPAFGYTLQEYATPMVVNAQPGQTVEMDFGELNSFPKSFMEKVAVKTQQNVSFGFHYNWKHVGQEIKIPAGTVVDTNFDWYGPAKMQELYGMYK